MGESSAIHGFHPITDGIRLARALRSSYQLHLGTVADRPETMEHWLRINGMSQPAFYQELHYREQTFSDLPDAAMQAQHARQLRAHGFDLRLVVSSDPETILQVTEAGIPSLLFVNPSYRWAEYRPDRKKLPRSWQDIDEEITRQLELRASDPRLNDEEEVERI